RACVLETAVDMTERGRRYEHMTLLFDNHRLRQVVKQAEWVIPPHGHHPDLGRWCPICRGWESNGHAVTCPYYGGKINGILANPPENPYAAVIEKARSLAVTLH